MKEAVLDFNFVCAVSFFVYKKIEVIMMLSLLACNNGWFLCKVFSKVLNDTLHACANHTKKD